MNYFLRIVSGSNNSNYISLYKFRFRFLYHFVRFSWTLHNFKEYEGFLGSATDLSILIILGEKKSENFEFLLHVDMNVTPFSFLEI